jgi:hypothetical protein
MIKAYPKIFAIGQDYIRDIFENEVEVTEKIDGSQFAFGKFNGNLYMRSKGRQIFEDHYDSLFKQAVEYVLSIREDIPENTFFYCEYLQSPKHNSLQYNNVPKNNLMLFGVCDSSDKFVDDYGELESYAEEMGLDIVPLLHKGPINGADQIFEFLGEESVLGGAKREGVVVKNYHKPFLLGGQPIPLMAGKYVSEEFKEVHSNGWKKEKTSKGKFEVYKDQFRTETRWEKAVQHLRDNGELENSPKDIGKLIKEVQNDITEEEKENIKEFLFKEFGQEILRYSTRGLPEWYKEKLLKNSFNN